MLDEHGRRTRFARRGVCGRSSWQLAPGQSPSLRRERRLTRWKDVHPVLEARKIQENCRCRPARRDHREPPVLSPDPVVEIYERTEPARVDKAD